MASITTTIHGRLISQLENGPSYNVLDSSHHPERVTQLLWLMMLSMYLEVGASMAKIWETWLPSNYQVSSLVEMLEFKINLCVQTNGGICFKIWVLRQVGGQDTPWLRWARGFLFQVESHSLQQNRKIMELSMFWILVRVFPVDFCPPKGLIFDHHRTHKIP